MPNFLTRPLTNKPRTIADQVAAEIDPANTTGERGYVKPFLAGATQGLGDVLTDFTSPLGIASLAAGPLGRLKGLASVARLVQEGRVGRNLLEAEKAYNVVDEAGRPLLQAGGYASKIPSTGAQMTEGTMEAIQHLKDIKTPPPTRIKPPRLK